MAQKTAGSTATAARKPRKKTKKATADPVSTVVKASRDKAKVHLKFLAKLPTWKFVVVVGLWTVVFKTLLVPVVALLHDYVFSPLRVSSIYGAQPVLDCADWLTQALYKLPYMHWSVLAIATHLLFSALIFPAVATAVGQVLPLKMLEKQVPNERTRAWISIGVMGLLYLVCFGDLAFFVSGCIIGVPLLFTFFHRMRVAPLWNVYLITFGVHAVANATVVVFRGISGDL